MTHEEFKHKIVIMECDLLEAKMWPTTLIVDPKVLKELFPLYRLVKYVMPSTGQHVNVEYGRPGEFRIDGAYVA